MRGVHVSPVRLPRLLGVLVLAFAESEAHGLYSAMALVRGFAIQLSYRWGLGTVIAGAGDRAVLLWSPVRHRQADMGLLRTILGVGAAVMTGVSLFVVSNLMMLLPLGVLLHLLNMSGYAARNVVVVVVVV